MHSEDSIVEEITVNVPKLRDISGHEAMARLSAFLQAVDVDCELDASGSWITYGPRAQDAEGPESDFIESLINIFDARLTAVPTIEERRAAEKLWDTRGNDPR